MFTQAVEVPARSDSASTRLPRSRAATFAEGMSAVVEGPLRTVLPTAYRVFSRPTAATWPVAGITRAVSAVSTPAVGAAMRGSSRLRHCRATADPSHASVGRMRSDTFRGFLLLWT